MHALAKKFKLCYTIYINIDYFEENFLTQVIFKLRGF